MGLIKMITVEMEQKIISYKHF